MLTFSLGHDSVMKVLSFPLTSCLEVCPQEAHSVWLKVLILKRLKTSGQDSRFSSRQKKKSLQSCCPILSILNSLVGDNGKLPRSKSVWLGATFCVTILSLSVWRIVSFTSVGSKSTDESFPCNHSNVCHKTLPVGHIVVLKSSAVKTSCKQLFSQHVSASEFIILLWMLSCRLLFFFGNGSLFGLAFLLGGLISETLL